jgi:Prokaryotic homologs of the JAB domain
VNLVKEIERAHAEVRRGNPGAREKLERLQAEYRTSGATISRIGGTCEVEDRPSAPFSHQPRSISRDVLNYGHPSSAVEIRARSTESRPFTVSLTSYSREQILDEIRHIRRQGDLEAAGWMWACQTPRSWSDSLTVALATHAGDSRHGRYSVEVGNPYLLREEQCPPELRHLKVIGDWHSHPFAGSTIPSDTDARAWAGWMDRYGLARFSAVIVSPAEQGGWMIPTFSAWTVRREGSPSRPICEPARIE